MNSILIPTDFSNNTDLFIENWYLPVTSYEGQHSSFVFY